MVDNVGPSTRLSDTLRPLIEQMSVHGSAPSSASRLGVILDYGHSDVGSTTENGVAQEVPTLEEGIKLLSERRNAVLQEFLSEIEKIHAGIQEGHLIDDGGGQYFVAQVVLARRETGGEDDLITAAAGVAVWWYPDNPLELERREWGDEDYWDDVFDS